MRVKFVGRLHESMQGEGTGFARLCFGLKQLDGQAEAVEVGLQLQRKGRVGPCFSFHRTLQDVASSVMHLL